MLKIRTLKGQNVKSIFRMIRMLKDQKVKNQNVENQNVKKNIESQKLTIGKSNLVICLIFKF